MKSANKLYSNVRRSSLTDRALPERSKSWAGNVIAQQLTDFSGKKLPESKLPEHRLKKKTEHGEVQDFVWAKTDMTGWRVTMEDADCCTPNLPEPLSDWSFFAVFDGHGGDETAKKAAEKLLPIFLAREEVKELKNGLEYSTQKIENALRESFIELDSALHHYFRKHRRWSGSTCTATLITPVHIFTANLGDSRTILVQRAPVCPLMIDQIASSIQISEDEKLEIDADVTKLAAGVKFSTSDHKPTDAHESKRISTAGLKIRDGRVQGNLAVSRAFGDFQYKKVEDVPQLEQPVSCLPDVHCIKRSKNDEYVVLACDGIYDVLSNDELTVLLRAKFAEKERVEQTAEEILNICLNRGSIDNMTMIIIAFENIFDEEVYITEHETINEESESE